MKWFYFLVLILLVVSCRKDGEVEPLHLPALMEIPKGFPDIDFPEGNEFTKARWDLGKRLFFDVALSVDSSISCATCHQSDLAFSDDVAFSLGVAEEIGTRNSPSLANVAYQPYLTREGGVPTLEMQVLVPIQEHNEFNFNIVLIADRLKNDSSYIKMAQEAYDREVDAFVITRAIACFERSLLSGYSPYDQYQNYDKLSALSDAAIRGMNLFFSEKTNCSKCHSDFNFTNYAFENNGLYETYPDEGRFRLTGEESDRALFKVPSLRNIELTAPYMHDGSLQTLEEVIEHYQSGGKNHPHKNEFIQPLTLSEKEKDDLIQFLKSLTDESFISNPLFTE
ncbi:MAG: cytochrome c peroxidase [Polaribacter sp.]|jgi:cytochrome c peroxidase